MLFLEKPLFQLLDIIDDYDTSRWNTDDKLAGLGNLEKLKQAILTRRPVWTQNKIIEYCKKRR